MPTEIEAALQFDLDVLKFFVRLWEERGRVWQSSGSGHSGETLLRLFPCRLGLYGRIPDRHGMGIPGPKRRRDAVLLLGVCEDQEWKRTESSPLPEGTRIGDNNITDAINPGNDDYYGKYTAGVHYAGEDRWELCWLNSYEVMLYAKGIDAPGPGAYSSILYGDHSWKDVGTTDWSTIPSEEETNFRDMSPEEIRRRLAGYLSRDGWAAVLREDGNPVSLFMMPDEGSEQVGLFYSGTPAHVLEKQNEWIRVKIGGKREGRIYGWIHSKDLVFGDGMLSVSSSAVTDREWAHPVITVHGAAGS